MNNTDGAPNPNSIQIAIVWTPATGQIQLGWPPVDDVIKLGMLEMAKCALLESRAKSQQNRIQPVGAIPTLKSRIDQ